LEDEKIGKIRGKGKKEIKKQRKEFDRLYSVCIVYSVH
jgi:hypothetical protein